VECCVTCTRNTIDSLTSGSRADGYGEKYSARSSARNCISAGINKEKSEGELAWAHFLIADILNNRGVYQEALTHSREASSLDGTNAWYFEAQAEALNGLKRPSEGVIAGTQALRLSDGKYSTMHFTLGSAYFDQENRVLALQSFEKAAELDPHNTSAAYNAALCNLRLGYRVDAIKWFEDVLRRNPNHPERETMRREISVLSVLRE